MSKTGKNGEDLVGTDPGMAVGQEFARLKMT